MINAIFKIIYGIPLWIGTKMAKLVQQFVTELLTILAYRALWWIRVLFWLFVLYALVLLDPVVKPILTEPALAPVGAWMYDFYNRGLIVIMGLSIAAYATANLRRRFRRVRLEVRLLSEARDLRNQVRGGGGDNKGDDDVPAKSRKPSPKPTGAFKDTIIKVFQTMRSSQRHKDTYKHIDTEKLDPENTDLSMEQYLAAVGVNAQTEVDAMVGGKPVSHARTTPWNIGLGNKSGKTAKELEEEAEKLLKQAKGRTERVRGKYRNREPEGDREQDIFGDDDDE